MDELHDKSVLVVDDDPGMLRAMSKVLAGEGMQVTGVSDPVAVVKKLADSEKRFDVVITDLRMPMFSGRGVLALASALPELPVIIITAFGGPDVEAQALRLGAFAFLKIALGERQLDPGLAKFLLDRKIEIAAIAARPGAHLAAPDDKLEFDRVIAEFLKKNARARIL